METVINLPGITNTELKVVQQGHLYLKATTISDLVNSTGTALADWFIKPDRCPNNAPLSYLQYTNQGKPTSPTWNLFVKTLQRAYTTRTTNTLVRPLGCWLVQKQTIPIMEPHVLHHH
jgi:hypothetical protein